MSQTEVIEAKTGARQLGGKYLTFKLADEEYGLEILRVREIIGIMDITTVPRTPHYVMGVINLRGKVIPVTDLRLKFDMAGCERTNQTCIIVVDVGKIEMGIVVDSVSEVVNIASGDIEEAPEFGPEIRTEFILGMGKMTGRVIILLNIAQVMTGEDLAALQNIEVQ